MRAGRRILWWLLAAGLMAATLAGATVYGFFIDRDHLFPYRVALRVWGRIVPAPERSRRFHVFRSGAAQTTVSFQDVERLAALPYLRGYRPARGRSSVLRHDPALALDGLNLYISGDAPQAKLMDMDGAALRIWTTDVRKAFPGIVLNGRWLEASRFFRSAWPLPDGSVVTMFADIGLVRLGPSSEVLWAWPGRVHHELFVEGAESVWTLTQAERDLPDLRPGEPVIDNSVVQLSPDGRLVRQVSILDALRRSLYAPLLTRLPREPDVLHTNSLQVFDGSLAGRSPIFRRGNVLLSMRNIDVVGILDPDQGRIVWALTGPWHRQHCARLLQNGHLLLFDNLGSLSAASRVLELDPFTQELLWSFGGAPGEEFFSESGGFVSRLANGNTIVCETNAGRVLEVTPDRRIAWEFVNPERAGKKNELIASVYELERLPRDSSFVERAAVAPVFEPGR